MENFLIEVVETIKRFFYTYWILLFNFNKDEIYERQNETKNNYTAPVIFLVFSFLIFSILFDRKLFHIETAFADFKFDVNVFSKLSFDRIISGALLPSIFFVLIFYIVSRIFFRKDFKNFSYNLLIYSLSIQILTISILLFLKMPLDFLVQRYFDIEGSWQNKIITFFELLGLIIILYVLVVPLIFSFKTIRTKYPKNIFYKTIILGLLLPFTIFFTLSGNLFLGEKNTVHIISVTTDSNHYNVNKFTYKKESDSAAVNLKIGFYSTATDNDADFIYLTKDEPVDFYIGKENDFKHYWNVKPDLRFKIINWSDDVSQFMRLEKNDIKWVELSARITPSKLDSIVKNEVFVIFGGFFRTYYFTVQNGGEWSNSTVSDVMRVAVMDTTLSASK